MTRSMLMSVSLCSLSLSLSLGRPWRYRGVEDEEVQVEDF
jgi:hypothetical protein